MSLYLYTGHLTHWDSGVVKSLRPEARWPGFKSQLLCFLAVSLWVSDPASWGLFPHLLKQRVDETLPFATKRTDLDNTMLSEISQIEQDQEL